MLAFPITDSTATQQSLFNTDVSGQVCTGVQKLAQRWVIELLTEQGSMGLHLSTRGSEFMTWVRRGNFRNEFDVQTYFNFAARQVKLNLITEDAESDPLDEQLDNATLNEIAITSTGIRLSVTITSLAGTTRDIILPISITPSNLQLN